MVEMIQEFSSEVIAEDGRRFVCRVYGAPQPQGPLWEAWLVFFPEDGGPPLVGDRETAQHRSDLLFWAGGLEAVYLEGALDRVARLQHILRREPWGARAAELMEEEEIAYRLARERLADSGRAAAPAAGPPG
jgi:hypothetical protein